MASPLCAVQAPKCRLDYWQGPASTIANSPFHVNQAIRQDRYGAKKNPCRVCRGFSLKSADIRKAVRYAESYVPRQEAGRYLTSAALVVPELQRQSTPPWALEAGVRTGWIELLDAPTWVSFTLMANAPVLVA